MTGISFRLRKYSNGLGQSFSIYNGKLPDSNERYHLGDTIYCMFEVDEKHVSATESLNREDFRIHRGMSKFLAQIPCKVVARDHAISWESVGKFQLVSTSLIVEPTSGYWEDLLLWVTTGKQPSWADDEETLDDQSS